MKIDLRFPASSTDPIPSDHGYPLFAALSRTFAHLHDHNGVGVHPISGLQYGNRRIRLTERSAVTIRCGDQRIADWLSLAGSEIEIAGIPVSLRPPRVYPLRPAAALRSRLVTIKGFLDAEPFVEAVRRQLTALDVAADAKLTIGKRRTVRVKDKEVVGFELAVEHLIAEESIAVQEQGIGGRRHMGCGVFVPLR